MKQRIIIAICAVAVLAGLPACTSPGNNRVAQTTDTTAGLPSSTDSAAVYAQLLVSDANGLNAQCPIMVDKETRLDNAQPMAKENTIRYNYTFVNREKKLFKDIPKVKESYTGRFLS